MGVVKKPVGGCADRMDITHVSLPDPMDRWPVRFYLLRYILRSSTDILLRVLKKIERGGDGKGFAIYRAYQRVLASTATLGT